MATPPFKPLKNKKTEIANLRDIITTPVIKILPDVDAQFDRKDEALKEYITTTYRKMMMDRDIISKKMFIESGILPRGIFGDFHYDNMGGCTNKCLCCEEDVGTEDAAAIKDQLERREKNCMWCGEYFDLTEDEIVSALAEYEDGFY